MHSGVEWDVMEYITIRGGIDQNYGSISEGTAGIKTDITAGVGIKYDGFRFDYAYHSDNAIPENSTHYFSISYFGTPVEKAKAKDEKENPLAYEEIFGEEWKIESEDMPIIPFSDEEKAETDDVYSQLFDQ